MSIKVEEVLCGGYGVPYDPEPALEKLKVSREEAILELWENLYHQGDVGVASYAAVPSLVEAGELSLVGAIEVARQTGKNPALPESMREQYIGALRESLSLNPQSEEQLQGYYIIHASIHGQHRLAKAIDLLSVEEIVSEYA